MTALEQLEHFKQQAETEIAALTDRCTSLHNENKQVKSELTQLRSTISELSSAAHAYVEEYRERAHEATSSEIALRARYVVLQDEIMGTARELQELALGLSVPEQVLYEHGYPVRGVNPLHKVREVRRALYSKVKALAKLGTHGVARS